jgi:hypothetical protein
VDSDGLTEAGWVSGELSSALALPEMQLTGRLKGSEVLASKPTPPGPHHTPGPGGPGHSGASGGPGGPGQPGGPLPPSGPAGAGAEGCLPVAIAGVWQTPYPGPVNPAPSHTGAPTPRAPTPAVFAPQPAPAPLATRGPFPSTR